MKLLSLEELCKMGNSGLVFCSALSFFIFLRFPWLSSNKTCDNEISPVTSNNSLPQIFLKFTRNHAKDFKSAYYGSAYKEFIPKEEMSWKPGEIKILFIVCLHSRPITIISDDKLVEEYFFIHPFRTTRNYSLSTTVLFWSLIAFVDFPKFKSDIIFICEDTQSRCNKQTVVISYNGFTDTFVLQNLNYSNISSHSQITDFDLERERVESLNKANNDTCQMQLYFYNVNSTGELCYVWRNADNDFGHVGSAYTAQMLENKFRLTRKLEEMCVFRIELNNSSGRPRSCNQLIIERGKSGYRAVYFHNTAKGTERVFKMIVDFSSRRIYFEHEQIEDSKLTKMLDHTGKSTEYHGFIRGKELHFSCGGSAVKFAQGGFAIWRFPGDENFYDRIPVNKIRSYYEEQDETFTDLFSLKIPKKLLKQRNASYINIVCQFPVWNIKQWIPKYGYAFIIDPRLSALTLKDESHGKEIPNESTLLLNDGDAFNVSCVGSGVPHPTITFQFDNKNRTLIATKSKNKSIVRKNLYLERIDKSREGVYRCVSKNLLGRNEVTFKLAIVTGHSSFVISLLITSCVAGSLFFLIGGFLLYKYRRLRMEFKRKTKEVVQRFQGGFKDIETNSCAFSADYNTFELPMCHWDFGGKVIGKGAFGTVRRGFISKGQKATTVAIKIINAPKNVKEFETSLKELLIMAYIGMHPHIVNLIATCTDNMSKRSLMLATEFCLNGDILSFIKKNKSYFHKANKSSTQRYLNIKDDQSEFYVNTENNHENTFSTWDLNIWALQIADGMSFLESKKVLHGDLAARNVLLTEHKIAKICDFGLSRQLTDDDNYTKKTYCPLPWKWMAPESLLCRQFSSKSDVWSYGVTLYEIFSIGEEPWPFMEWNEEFMDRLQQGRRLAMPKYASQEMYQTVMLECWRNNPDDRPSFADLKTSFPNFVVKQQ